MRILYIEDEPADAQLVQRYAAMTKHELVVASDLQSAHTALESPPDLILVDVMLNDSRSGYQFVEELRAQGYEQPMIAVTGLALPADIQRCYHAGFTEVLTKPYELKQLANLLNKYSK
jgi:CheY-like chemotaxis protein